MIRKVMHVITGLPADGAQTMLYRLLSGIDRAHFFSCVVSLTGDGLMGPRIRALGVPVVDLGMARGTPNPRGLYRLWRLLRQERPNVVQTWLYHADLLGILGGRLAGITSIVWNVRCSSLEPGYYHGLSGLVLRLLARWSRLPQAVVVNSETGKQLHEKIGYSPRRWVVIPNGFDLETFRPNPDARAKFRQEIGVDKDTTLIGLVARFDRLKDHETFLKAAHAHLQNHPRSHFVLAGAGVHASNPHMKALLTSLALNDNVHLLGRRDDIPHVTAALDIATSSSTAEGFPNTVGEAMACAVPCAVTDVGDSAFLVGDTGRVVPPRAPEALADAWNALIAMGHDARAQLGRAARQRIAERFDLPRVIGLYEDLYRSLDSLGNNVR